MICIAPTGFNPTPQSEALRLSSALSSKDEVMARGSELVEMIVREGRAAFLRNGKATAGILFLTDQRLLFVARPYATQQGETLINLWDIHAIRPCWKRFLGLIPLLPNSLLVDTASGEAYRFTLADRFGWAKAISRQADVARASRFSHKRIIAP